MDSLSNLYNYGSTVQIHIWRIEPTGAWLESGIKEHEQVNVKHINSQIHNILPAPPSTATRTFHTPPTSILSPFLIAEGIKPPFIQSILSAGLRWWPDNVFWNNRKMSMASNLSGPARYKSWSWNSCFVWYPSLLDEQQCFAVLCSSLVTCSQMKWCLIGSYIRRYFGCQGKVGWQKRCNMRGLNVTGAYFCWAFRTGAFHIKTLWGVQINSGTINAEVWVAGQHSRFEAYASRKPSNVGTSSLTVCVAVS